MLQPEDAKYLKRKIKSGSIDVHPTEKALIVNYELEAIILSDQGQPMVGDRKECQKIIRLHHLNENTDIEALAREVIKRCNLIHEGSIGEIEQLLYYLQKRKDSGVSSNRRKPAPNELQDPGIDSAEIDEISNLNDVEEYMSLLYEEIPEKIKSTALILQLARNPDNLEELIQNEPLLNSLSRVLREDWKQNTDLATNVIYIFFCFSSFREFHPIISHFKIGALTMQVVEYELVKYRQWRDELQKKKKKNADEFEKSKVKFEKLVRKQEQLLRVSFYMLLNIAEDVNVEIKMRNKQIITMLVGTLDRDNSELLILVISFLKKLSMYRENKDDMVRLNIVDKMARLFTMRNEDLLNITLRLLLNLSFEPKLRIRMVQQGFIQKLVPLLDKEQQRYYALCLLYHMSMEDKCKPLFAKSGAIPVLMKQLLTSGDDKIELELIGLCINIVLDETCATLICGKGGLKTLMRKAMKKRNPFMMKMIRNIATHDKLKANFVDYVPDLADAILRVDDNEDFVLECIGLLASVAEKDLDWALLFNEYGLTAWLQQQLSKESETADDLLLECIMLVGTACTDAPCAAAIANEGFVQLLLEILNAKQEDDEILLQTIYVFYQMVLHETTRQMILQQTQVPAYLIDLINDKNVEVKKLCDQTLAIVGETDPKWAKKIVQERFKWHNSQWLDMIKAHPDNDMINGEFDEDGALHFQDANVWDQSDAFAADMEYGFDEMDPSMASEYPGYEYRSDDRPRLTSDGQDLDEYGMPSMRGRHGGGGYD